MRSKDDVSSALDSASIGIKASGKSASNNGEAKDKVIELDLESLPFRDGGHTMTNKLMHCDANNVDSIFDNTSAQVTAKVVT